MTQPTAFVVARRVGVAAGTAIMLLASARGAVAQPTTSPLGPSIAVAMPAAARPTAPPSSPSGVPLATTDVNAWLDGYMPYALRTGDIAGAVVAVVQNGAIVTIRGYGYSDVARRIPVDPATTLFRPGSVSKLVTWTAVMQQVEQGRIDLDADINRYLDFRIPPRDGKPVTMRNLMQHVAGFEEQAKNIISTDGRPVPTYDALLKRWVPERIYPAGTTPAYSNYGASLAGYIVQRVSGEPFDVYVERHIFGPLAMTHSTFRQPLPASLAAFMSRGYPAASKPATGFEIVGPAPAGAMSSSGEDMAHFMIAHLANGAYGPVRILQEATARRMHDSPLTLLPPLNRMELGFFETNINGHEVIGHLGDTGDFHTSLHLFLDAGVGFYVSFNSAGKAGAAGVLRSALFQDFADRYLPPTAPTALTARVDSATAATHAAMMAGSWISSRRSASNFFAAATLLSEMKVGAGKNGLVVPVPGPSGAVRHWTEIAPFVWRDQDSHERLAAKVVDGKVVRFSFDDASPFMVMDRAPWYKDSAWLLPVLILALVALAVTAIRWPIAALVRRHYGATLLLDVRSLRAYRWSRLAAAAIIGAMLLWGLFFTRLLSDMNRMSASTDTTLRATELFGVLAFGGGLLVMLWNLWTVWTGHRRWPARVWSVVLTLSAASVLWVAIAFRLTSVGVNY